MIYELGEACVSCVYIEIPLPLSVQKSFKSWFFFKLEQN